MKILAEQWKHKRMKEKEIISFTEKRDYKEEEKFLLTITDAGVYLYTLDDRTKVKIVFAKASRLKMYKQTL